MSIRIIDPADPRTPYLSQCQEVPPNRNRNLCSMATVDLETTALPLKDLEVQVALYPGSVITTDPLTGADICPADTQYDAVNGFPIENEVAPAVGGRTFYRPGDETIVVTLGCTNLELVNDPTCSGLGTVRVGATVDDFDSGFPVNSDARRLGVSVGEPKQFNLGYVLNPGDVIALLLTENVVTPSWNGFVDRFSSIACLAVLDDTPQSTTTLTCKSARVVDEEITFTGTRLTKTSLDQILRALSLTQFPPQGLTVGVVLDVNNNPLANQVIAAPIGTTIQYLSSDRSSVGGTMTSGGPLGGVFVAVDSPLGTLFSTTSGSPMAPQPQMGGRVEGKVTMLMLRFADPPIEE